MTGSSKNPTSPSAPLAALPAPAGQSGIPAKVTSQARVQALETLVADLAVLPNSSRRLHRELRRTCGRLRVWRRRLEVANG